MKRKKLVWFLLICVTFTSMVFAGDKYMLSSLLSPEVSVSVKKGRDYSFEFDVDNPYAKVSGRLIIGGKKGAVYKFDKFPAKVSVAKDNVVDGQVFLALEVSWFNADGSLRQREVFNSPEIGGELPKKKAFLRKFDIEEYFTRVADDKLRIYIPVELKEASKVTVVIEDINGRRIRNLVSGIQYPAGLNEIEWDGMTDYGAMVAPGTYNYRLITHPGLSHDMLMQFSNGKEEIFTPYGPNHSQFHNLCSNDKYIFAAAPNTEGGNAIISMKPDGEFVRGYHKHLGTGLTTVYPVANDSRLYILNDGVSWGGSREKTQIQVSCYDIETGNVIQLKSRIKKSGRNIRYNTLCDSSMPEVDGKRETALQGAAMIGDTIYFSHLGDNQIMMYDIKSDDIVGSIPVASPGRLAGWNNQLYAVSGNDIVRVDPSTKQTSKMFAVDFEPKGLTVNDSGFYLLGAPDSTVKVFNDRGKVLRSIGKPGGYYTGAWQPERLVNPNGIMLANDNSLWVAEKRKNPKRLTKWNTRTGKVLYEKYGPPSYGSPSAGFDTEDSSRWIADGCLWNIDPDSKKAEIVSILMPEKGHLDELGSARSYRFVRHDGRTFVIGHGNATTISELMPDNTLKDLAMISSPNIFSFSIGRREVPAFYSALKKTFPDTEFNRLLYNQQIVMLWVDQDGDAKFDENEFQFMPLDLYCQIAMWGFNPNDLSFPMCFRTKEGQVKVMYLDGHKFNACGAPDYDLATAIAAAKPAVGVEIPGVKPPPNGPGYTDHHDNVIINESPYMYSFNKSGALNWIFPNSWPGVHGSQKAPLPIPGEIQGQLFALGVVPLDSQRDVMALMNNHGRIFFMTTDGIYLDELFSDVRVSYTRDDTYIGGEHFGGVFDYDKKNKRYLLQAGNSGYRIYRIDGLDKLSEKTGRITVSARQLDAAARLHPVSEDVDENKELEIAYRKEFDIDQLKREQYVAEWQGTQDPIKLKAYYDDKNLYVSFSLSDASPWVNNGKDITTLFKTGDCVDLQIATDLSSTAQDTKRRDAAAGDVRVLIAPFGEKSTAVLYRHVVKNKSSALIPMEFNSPWRGYKVDDVKVLDGVDIEVSKGSDQYSVYASIPLSDLGISAEQIKGRKMRGDFGVILGDSEGTVNLARLYWSNKATGLVNDVPGEMMPEPHYWGTLMFEGDK